MGWRGSWRTIPPELLVPTVVVGLVRPLVVLLDLETGAYVIYIVVATHTILVLFGLLELRRRLTGWAARWIAAAAAVQAVAVLKLIVFELAPLFEIDEADLLAFEPSLRVWLALALAVLLSTAARSWRSPLGPLLVATSVLGSPPGFLHPAIVEVIDDKAGLFFALVWFAHAAVLLATYARFGAATVPALDFARAERAARRAARWQRLRLAVVAFVGASFALMLRQQTSESFVMSQLAWPTSALTVGGVVSGLLGLARSNIPGLSPRALCVAAFATLGTVFTADWDVFHVYDLWETGHGADAWQVASVLANLAGVAVGVAAIGSYLRTLDDRPLARAVGRWLTGIVVLGLASAVAVVVGPRGDASQMVAATVFVLVAEAIMLLMLAHVHARLARKLVLTSAVEAF